MAYQFKVGNQFHGWPIYICQSKTMNMNVHCSVIGPYLVYWDRVHLNLGPEIALKYELWARVICASYMNYCETVWCLWVDTCEGLHQIDGKSYWSVNAQDGTRETIKILNGLRGDEDKDIEWFERRQPEAEVASDAAVVSCCLLHVWAIASQHIKHYGQAIIYHWLRQELLIKYDVPITCRALQVLTFSFSLLLLPQRVTTVTLDHNWSINASESHSHSLMQLTQLHAALQTNTA